MQIIPGDLGSDLKARDRARDSTLPVKNQLMAKMSSVPKVRQLTALSTDLVCVSAPRNDKATRLVSLAVMPVSAVSFASQISNGHAAGIRALCPDNLEKPLI